jgi:STE24 endopeptidase
MQRWVCRVLLLLCCSQCCTAGTHAAPSTIPAPTAVPLVAQAPPEQPLRSQPVLPGTAPPERPKTQEYKLSQDRYEKAVAYSHAWYTLYFVSYFLGAVVLFLILRSGVAAKFRDFAENFSSRRWVQGLIFIPLLVLTVDLFDLPLRVYGHSLSLHYQMSVQRWGSWLWDWTKEELLGIAFALVLVLLLFAVMRRSPRRWWLYFWLAAMPIMAGVIFSSPWIIDPLFHKFEPLNDTQPQLVQSLEKIVARTGLQIPPDRMFLMRASEKTNAINAYVTGFGASKRIVIWDTTIQKTARNETLFIVGHELGHYVLGHFWKGVVAYAFGLLLIFYLLFRGLHWSLDHWAGDWKLYGPEDWAALAVFLLMLQFLTFFASPIISGFSRMQEHAADIYGIEVIHGIVPDSAEVAAHAFQVLGEQDLADPNPSPFITFWLYSHPPLGDRLVFAHSYDPWSKGESLKYVK